MKNLLENNFAQLSLGKYYWDYSPDSSQLNELYKFNRELFIKDLPLFLTNKSNFGSTVNDFLLFLKQKDGRKASKNNLDYSSLLYCLLGINIRYYFDLPYDFEKCAYPHSLYYQYFHSEEFNLKFKMNFYGVLPKAYDKNNTLIMPYNLWLVGIPTNFDEINMLF